MIAVGAHCSYRPERANSLSQDGKQGTITRRSGIVRGVGDYLHQRRVEVGLELAGIKRGGHDDQLEVGPLDCHLAIGGGEGGLREERPPRACCSGFIAYVNGCIKLERASLVHSCPSRHWRTSLMSPNNMSVESVRSCASSRITAE